MDLTTDVIANATTDAITDEQAEHVIDETITEYPQTWDDNQVGQVGYVEAEDKADETNEADETDTVADFAEDEEDKTVADNGLAENSSSSNVADKLDFRIPTAAYCRVSTNKDIQDGSFEVQRDYYRNLINSDPRLRLVDIYGDQGKSGRNMRDRKELNRLIADCEAGKVKLILTKSISRFSRNMMECVGTIRHLSSLGVTVRFEKEGISTDNMCGELLLGILATIAEEESRSISQNMNWSRRKHIECGQPWEPARYGYKSVGKEHKWIPDPHEMAVVRQAFYMAGMCYKIPEIMDELNRMEEEAGKDRRWGRTTLRNMLTSTAYVGEYLSNKECTIVDKKTGQVKRVKNQGYVEQIKIEGHHEAIVSRELFDIVQKLVTAGVLSAVRTNFSKNESYLIERAIEVTAKEKVKWDMQAQLQQTQQAKQECANLEQSDKTTLNIDNSDHINNSDKSAKSAKSDETDKTAKGETKQ